MTMKPDKSSEWAVETDETSIARAIGHIIRVKLQWIKKRMIRSMI